MMTEIYTTNDFLNKYSSYFPENKVYKVIICNKYNKNVGIMDNNFIYYVGKTLRFSDDTNKQFDSNCSPDGLYFISKLDILKMVNIYKIYYNTYFNFQNIRIVTATLPTYAQISSSGHEFINDVYKYKYKSDYLHILDIQSITEFKWNEDYCDVLKLLDHNEYDKYIIQIKLANEEKARILLEQNLEEVRKLPHKRLTAEQREWISKK